VTHTNTYSATPGFTGKGKKNLFCTMALDYITISINLTVLYGIGNAVPLQAWTGPEGSSRLMLPDFKTVGT